LRIEAVHEDDSGAQGKQLKVKTPDVELVDQLDKVYGARSLRRRFRHGALLSLSLVFVLFSPMSERSDKDFRGREFLLCPMNW
jgi:hypothetical protein